MEEFNLPCQCTLCGYKKNLTLEELQMGEGCPLCGGVMADEASLNAIDYEKDNPYREPTDEELDAIEREHDNFDDTQTEPKVMTEENEIDLFKDGIAYGLNDNIYFRIEEIKDVKIRLHKRTLFFKAGGTTPERKHKNEK